MCFSATASFTAAGILTILGTISIQCGTSPAHRALAAIPLGFGAQQAAEGVVWLTMNEPGQARLASAAITIFLGFAWVLWPVWLPVSLLLIERDAERRKYIRICVWIGIAVALYGTIVLSLGCPAARISQHSIRYEYPQIGHPWIQSAWLLAYVVPTVVPFLFVSTQAVARVIGLILFTGLVTTLIIENNALTSVWCFFATAISVCIVGDAFKQRAVVLDPA